MLPFLAGLFATSSLFYLASTSIRRDAERYSSVLSDASEKIVKVTSPDLVQVSIFTSASYLSV